MADESPSSGSVEPSEADSWADSSAVDASSHGDASSNDGASWAPGRPRRRLVDYPRRGKAGLRRWFPSPKLILAVFTSFVLLLTGSAMAVYAAIPVPGLKASVGQQHLTVLDRTGKVIGIRGPEIRQDVPLTRVPTRVQNAVLAAEDRNFWSESAISVTGTARAAVNDTLGGATQGGSTITQQYVKNAYLDDARSLTRKVKEAVIALKISKEKSKDEILAGYLNTVYFGRGASGIQMAARAWFNKDVDQLTVAEGAVLAAAVNAPSYYETASKDPQALAKLTSRWGYVLDGMVSMGKLTAAERAAQQFPTIAAWPKPSSATDAQYPYLVEAAIAEAQQKLGLDRQTLVTGGYTIKTTFDTAMQDAAAAAVQQQITDNLDPKKRTVDGYVQTAIATVVPGDGAVRVLYGGADYAKQAFNASWQGTIAPGSTFKAFVLAAYLQNGGSAADIVDGSSPLAVPSGSGTTYQIPNEGGASYGPVSVRYAAQQSINTAFVRMSQQAGAKNVIAAAHAAGIPQGTDIQDVPTMPLGVLATDPMQMAGGYATFAAHGVQTTPYTVDSVTQGGKTVYQAPKTPAHAFDATIADQVTDVLKSVVTDGSGAAAQLSDGRDVAGKTGTTDLDGGDRASAWFVGYTPQLSTAVAVWGQKPDGSLVSVNGMMGRQLGGGAVAAPLWSAYMNKAVAGTPATAFQLTLPAPTGSASSGAPDSSGGSVQNPNQNPNQNQNPNGQNPGQNPNQQPAAPNGSSPSAPTSSSSGNGSTPPSTPSSNGATSSSATPPTTPPAASHSGPTPPNTSGTAPSGGSGMPGVLPGGLPALPGASTSG
jgi:membrane peptidoglycan carboxypeptidase